MLFDSINSMSLNDSFKTLTLNPVPARDPVEEKLDLAFNQIASSDINRCRDALLNVDFVIQSDKVSGITTMCHASAGRWVTMTIIVSFSGILIRAEGGPSAHQLPGATANISPGEYRVLQERTGISLQSYPFYSSFGELVARGANLKF